MTMGVIIRFAERNNTQNQDFRNLNEDGLNHQDQQQVMQETLDKLKQTDTAIDMMENKCTKRFNARADVASIPNDIEDTSLQSSILTSNKRGFK